MEGDSQTLKFSVVLPTKRLPPYLEHIKTPPLAQFLVGYRNVLVKNEAGLQWGLVKNKSFCGRAFVFQISEADAHNIQQIKRQGELIEIVAGNYILLKIEKEVSQLNQSLTLEQLIPLLDQVGGVNKINLNLIKNVFETYSKYRQIAEKCCQSLGFVEPKKEYSSIQKTQIELDTKMLSGKYLLQIPQVSKQTGNWSETEQTVLKFSYQ